MGRKLKLELIPTCVGTHEPGENLCDGDRESGGKDAESCSWRERCIAFQRHLEDTGDDDERYIEIVDITSKPTRERTGWKRTAKAVDRTFDEFVKFTAGLVRIYNVKKLPPPEKKQKKPSKEKPAKKKKRKMKLQSEDPERREKARNAIVGFCKTLRDKTGRKLLLSKRATSPVTPGMFYIRNRPQYTSVYCRRYSREGRGGTNTQDIAIACLMPRYRANAMEVRIAVDVRHLQRALGRRNNLELNPEPISDGAFCTVCRRLQPNQVETLASAIADLIEQGIIELPPR